MKPTVIIKDVEALRIAYRTYQGPLANASKYMPSVFRSIKGKSNGSPFFNIHFINPQTLESKIDICVPTLEVPSSKEIFIKELPSVKVVSIIHYGSYDTMQHTYQQLEAYLQANQLSVIGATREIYSKGPGMILKGKPKDYITEIQLPIEEL